MYVLPQLSLKHTNYTVGFAGNYFMQHAHHLLIGWLDNETLGNWTDSSKHG